MPAWRLQKILGLADGDGDGLVIVAEADGEGVSVGVGVVDFWVDGVVLPTAEVTVGDAVIDWRADGDGDCDAVDEGPVTTLAPDDPVLAEVPVSDAVAALTTWLTDCDGLLVFPVSDFGGPLELSSSATAATIPPIAARAPHQL